MSNGILENHLRKEGIQVFRCAVGDRYVLDMMKSTASGLGGEQSGHVIIDHYVRTGDGLCTGSPSCARAASWGKCLKLWWTVSIRSRRN